MIANNDYGIAIDVWSFGVLICHMLRLSFGLTYNQDNGANPDEAMYDPFFKNFTSHHMIFTLVRSIFGIQEAKV
jgi:hypothetical protein